MHSITITRPVIIKVRVTDSYKKVLATELQKLVQQMDMEIQQLNFQYQSLQRIAEKNSVQDLTAASNKLEQEMQQRLQKKQHYLNKIKEIGRLEKGTEVVHGRVESLVELKVGDNWNRMMNVEILVEDGKVLEIRQGIFNPRDQGEV